MFYKKIIFKTSCFLLLFIFGVCFLTYSQKKSSVLMEKNELQATITYCNLDLPEKWRLGNLSFNSIYSFSVNNNGEVINIKKVRDNFIGEEEVKACISKWRMSGFTGNSQFSVYFVWKHDKGWVRQEILGNGFTQVMTFENTDVEQSIKGKNEEEP